MGRATSAMGGAARTTAIKNEAAAMLSALQWGDGDRFGSGTRDQPALELKADKTPRTSAVAIPSSTRAGCFCRGNSRWPFCALMFQWRFGRSLQPAKHRHSDLSPKAKMLQNRSGVSAVVMKTELTACSTSDKLASCRDL